MVVTKARLIRWLEKCAVALNENKAYLTELDSSIGDADHGVNLARGFSHIVQQLPGLIGGDIGALMKGAAMTMMSAVGGASGILYGAFFMRAATVTSGKESLTPAELEQMLKIGREGIVQRGRAEAGDKTMVDAWTPALTALSAALNQGSSLLDALAACKDAARSGMEATIPMQARKGRASYLGERSIGHQDPGATSTYLILNALYESLAEEETPK